jgi:hypothetical protein
LLQRTRLVRDAEFKPLPVAHNFEENMTKDRIDRVDGEIDDLVLHDVHYVRLERMDDGHIWLKFDGIALHLESSSQIDITDFEES